MNLENFYGTMCAIMLGLLLACFFGLNEQSNMNKQLFIAKQHTDSLNVQLNDSLKKVAINDSTYSIHFNKLVKDYESGRR